MTQSYIFPQEKIQVLNPTAFFREAGSGPAVLCIHASASTSGQWRTLMASLSDRFRMVAVDLYGYGKSPAWPAERELRLDDEIALLAPILETGSKFHLVGHSYGGLIALKLALNDPARIASLTLYEPVCFYLLLANNQQDPAMREIIAIRDEVLPLIDAGELELAGQRFVEYWTGPGAWSNTPEAARLAIANSMRKVRYEWPAAMDKALLSANYAALTMPILLLCGTQSTAAAQAVFRRLSGLLPQAKVVELPGLGHMGPVTHPQEVNEVIAGFLETALKGTKAGTR